MSISVLSEKIVPARTPLAALDYTKHLGMRACDVVVFDVLFGLVELLAALSRIR